MTTLWRSGPRLRHPNLHAHRTPPVGELRGDEPRRSGIVSGSRDKTLAIWDLDSGTLIHTLAGHQDAVTSVAVSPDGLRSSQVLRQNGGGLGPRLRHANPHAHRTPTLGDLRGSESRRTAHRLRVTRRNRRDLGSQRRHPHPHAHRAPGFGDLRGGESRRTRIVSGSLDKTVAVWELQTGQRLTILSLDGNIWSVAWDRDGRFVVAGDAGGNLYRLEYREP